MGIQEERKRLHSKYEVSKRIYNGIVKGMTASAVLMALYAAGAPRKEPSAPIREQSRIEEEIHHIDLEKRAEDNFTKMHQLLDERERLLQSPSYKIAKVGYDYEQKEIEKIQQKSMVHTSGIFLGAFGLAFLISMYSNNCKKRIKELKGNYVKGGIKRA